MSVDYKISVESEAMARRLLELAGCNVITPCPKDAKSKGVDLLVRLPGKLEYVTTDVKDTEEIYMGNIDETGYFRVRCPFNYCSEATQYCFVDTRKKQIITFEPVKQFLEKNFIKNDSYDILREILNNYKNVHYKDLKYTYPEDMLKRIKNEVWRKTLQQNEEVKVNYTDMKNKVETNVHALRLITTKNWGKYLSWDS